LKQCRDNNKTKKKIEKIEKEKHGVENKRKTIYIG